MVAVGDDIRRTCTCTLVKWEGPNAPSVMSFEVVSYDPAKAGDEDGTETMIVTIHYFDGKPCHLK